MVRARRNPRARVDARGLGRETSSVAGVNPALVYKPRRRGTSRRSGRRERSWHRGPRAAGPTFARSRFENQHREQARRRPGFGINGTRSLAATFNLDSSRAALEFTCPAPQARIILVANRNNSRPSRRSPRREMTTGQSHVPSPWFHAGRTPRSHRHRGHLNWPAAAGRTENPRCRKLAQLQEQSQDCSAIARHVGWLPMRTAGTVARPPRCPCAQE